MNGESSLTFDEFSFVELGGRPGHQGYYAISGLPLLGTSSKALARVSSSSSSSSAPATLSFEFRDLSGNTIAPFSLSSTDTDAHYLMGDVTVPSQSFRVYALGTNADGTSFQRLITTVVFPQSVVVNPPATVDLGQGQTTTYIFQVRNDGAPGSFNFAANDTAKFVTSVTPTSATLAAGQSVLVKVTLIVGSTVPVGTRDTLTVTATNSVDPNIHNFAVLTSTVVRPKVIGDVNNDGVVDCSDLNLVKASFGTRTGSLAFNPDVDVDSNGIIDIRDLSFVAKLLPAGTVCN